MSTAEIRELTAGEIEEVTGGARPNAGGPVPIPYGNVVAYPSGGTFFGGTNEAAGERE